MKVYYDKDCDLSIVQSMRIAILGYGSQGFAHANNLRDSGVTDLVIGSYEGSKSAIKAINAGFEVDTVADSVSRADLVMMLIPDEIQRDIYLAEVEPNLRPGSSIAFAHGFNVHYGLIEPRADIDVIMVAPKGPGHTVRANYESGIGILALFAVAQDVSGRAHEVALSYSMAIGAGRAGIMQTSFREETETDLFGEQVVLCGGASALVLAAFETLVEAGYAPEMAYFECLHELKLIVDFFYEGGVTNMWYTVSNTAEYGGHSRGQRIITDQTKEEMRQILDEIQRGKFAQEFVTECQAGAPTVKSLRRLSKEHLIEQVGKRLRALMPWIQANKLVDPEKN